MRSEFDLKAWLIAQGFAEGSPDALIENRTTPLMHACRLADGPAVDALLAAGASLADLNGDGNNALWLACYGGDTGIIERLIEAGIDIDHQNEGGSSALMYAASSGKTAVVAQLLEAGADVHLKNPDDFSALDMAANLECLQLLRAAGRRQSAVS